MANRIKGDPYTPLVYAALRDMLPGPPPVDDDPPREAIIMLLGMVLGRLGEKHPDIPKQAITAAANRILAQTSVENMIKLIW